MGERHVPGSHGFQSDSAGQDLPSGDLTASHGAISPDQLKYNTEVYQRGFRFVSVAFEDPIPPVFPRRRVNDATILVLQQSAARDLLIARLHHMRAIAPEAFTEAKFATSVLRKSLQLPESDPQAIVPGASILSEAACVYPYIANKAFGGRFPNAPELPVVGSVVKTFRLRGPERIGRVYLTMPIMEDENVIIWDATSGVSNYNRIVNIQWSDLRTPVRMWNPEWRKVFGLEADRSR